MKNTTKTKRAGGDCPPPSCSADLVERIAKDSFHSPFVAPYTRELRRVLNWPNGSVHDTMIGDLYKRLARLYSSMPNADVLAPAGEKTPTKKLND